VQYCLLTLRTLLIFLYGTGAAVGEALQLLDDDVDLGKGTTTIRVKRFRLSRTIPIGPDLKQVLNEYLDSRQRQETRTPHSFVTKEGDHLKPSTLIYTLRKLRRRSGIIHLDASVIPRIFDLRHTFAVHQIAGWIKHGADLNRMLPALAVYMGLTGLRSTEPYLSDAGTLSHPASKVESPALRKKMEGRSRADEILISAL
jgi:integrase/recombinase XerD